MKNFITAIAISVSLSTVLSGCDWFKKGATPTQVEANTTKSRTAMRDAKSKTSTTTTLPNTVKKDSPAETKKETAEKPSAGAEKPNGAVDKSGAGDTGMQVVESNSIVANAVNATEKTADISKHEPVKEASSTDNVVSKNLRDSSEEALKTEAAPSSDKATVTA